MEVILELSFILFFSFYHLLFFYFKFIYLNWRIISLQYCGGFCHTPTGARVPKSQTPRMTLPSSYCVTVLSARARTVALYRKKVIHMHDIFNELLVSLCKLEPSLQSLVLPLITLMTIVR